MSGDAFHLTYYGYEQPGQPDFDENSYNGIGDRQNTLQVGLSVALSVSARQKIFGLSADQAKNSTGQTFTYQGQTYRDDDTSPQGFANIDVYSPGGVPGTASYNSNQTTPLGSGQIAAGSGTTTLTSATTTPQTAQESVPLSQTSQAQKTQAATWQDVMQQAFDRYAQQMAKIPEEAAKVQEAQPHFRPAPDESSYLVSTNQGKTAQQAPKTSFAAKHKPQVVQASSDVDQLFPESTDDISEVYQWLRKQPPSLTQS